MTEIDLRDVHGELLWMRAYRPDPVPAGWRMVRDGLDGAAYRHHDGRAAILSGNREGDGRRWLHLSVSRASRLPSWADLTDARDAFLPPDRYAYQVFPPRPLWVNLNPNVLHLWCPLDGGPPLPEFSAVVGGRRSI
jgi:hypothetical protein